MQVTDHFCAALAVACLLLGLCLGYVLRGAKPEPEPAGAVPVLYWQNQAPELRGGRVQAFWETATI